MSIGTRAYKWLCKQYGFILHQDAQHRWEENPESKLTRGVRLARHTYKQLSGRYGRENLHYFDGLEKRVLLSGTDAIISGQAWQDVNGNGLQSINDNGISGIMVQLHNDAGVVVDSTTTDINGEYMFSVALGDYQVSFISPANDIFTLSNVGSDASVDSNVDSTGYSSLISAVSIGQTLDNIDAGLYQPVTFQLDSTVRDFQSSHPDFQNGTFFSGGNIAPGLVSQQLGPDGLPDFAGIPGEYITSSTTFDQWYTDVQDINIAVNVPLDFVETGVSTGVFQFEDSSFFPINTSGFGIEAPNANNQHFTLGTHAQFTYNPGQFVSLMADDDAWLYIDGQLAIDLGGVHPAEFGTVDLSTLALTAGQTYDFDLFFAERMTSESVLDIQTNVALYQGPYVPPVQSVSGTVWEDYNGNGTRDTSEPGMRDVTLFLDTNGNAGLDAGELSTISGEDGTYQFTNVPVGSYVLYQQTPLGWVQTYPFDPSAGSLQNATASTQHVNQSYNGTTVWADSYEPAINVDGSVIAFHSGGPNYVANDTNGLTDIFVYKTSDMTTVRASVASDGTQANGASMYASLSHDGRYVAFESDASNLVLNDTNGVKDIFVYDLQTQQIQRVSIASDGTQANGASEKSTISGDGRYITFTSTASNLVSGDTNGVSDVFVYDLQTQSIERVSLDSVGIQANGASYETSISDSGQYIAYTSSASNLALNDNNGTVIDVFLYDRQAGQTTLVSIGNEGQHGNTGFNSPVISGDGRTVSFVSGTALFSGDVNAKWDFYIKDMITGTLQIPSLTSGYGINGLSDLSYDGRYMAFTAFDNNLVSGDTNSTWDIFVFDRQLNETTRVSLASDGTNTDNQSIQPTISADGQTVAYSSRASNLFAGDINNGFDIFSTSFSGVSSGIDGSTLEILAGTKATDLLFGNQPLAYVTGNTTVPEGSPFTLELYQTDTVNFPVTQWQITWGDGTALQTFAGNTSTTTHTYMDGYQVNNIQVTAVSDTTSWQVTPHLVFVENVKPSVTIDNAVVTVDESQVASNSGTFFDPGNDVVSLTTSLGTVTDNLDGTWSWSFNSSDGPDESQVVTITATDSDGAATSTAFDLTVNNVAPVIAVTNALVVIDESDTATNTGTFSDAGVDTLVLTTTLGTVTDNLDGTWSWSFNSADGPDESQVVTVTATDSDGAATSTTFGLVVNNVAPAIAVTNALVTIDEAQTATNTGTFSDVGVDLVNLTTSLGTVTDNLDGTWSWSFNSSDGPDESQVVTVTATDSDGAATNVTFDLTVNNVAPVIAVTNALVTINESQTATNTGTFNDVGVDTLVLTTTLGTVTDNLDGTWSWSFDSNDGPDESQVVTVTATDSDGAATNVTFDLTVNNVTPVIAVTNALVVINEADTATNTGTFNDVGVDTLVLTTTLGTVTDNLDGTWSWSFNSADGPDESQVVTVTATDSDGAATSTTFDLTVNNVAPVLTVDAMSIDVNQREIAVNQGTIMDPGDDALQIAASIGFAVLLGDGTWQWQYDTTDFMATNQSVTITVTDEDGASNAVSFGLNITPTSYMAVDNASVIVDEGSTVTNTGVLIDLDVDANAQLAASVGSVIDNGDGTWSWSLDALDGPDQTQEVVITASITGNPIAMGNSLNPVISGGGDIVVFESGWGKYAYNDTNAALDIFAYESLTGKIRRISVSSTGTQADGASSLASISNDERYIVYESDATNLIAGDTNLVKDIFLYDMLTQQVRRISVASDGIEANGASYDASISGNGRYVSFTSDASNLVADDTNGVSDIFIYDTQTGAIERISVDSQGGQANGASRDSSMTDEGRYIVYTTYATNLDVADTNAYADIYLYDRLTGQTSVVSVTGSVRNNQSDSPAISADGSVIAFVAGDALIPEDINGEWDYYLYDVGAGLYSTPDPVNLVGYIDDVSLSDDGQYMFFTASDNVLVPGDINGFWDIFQYDRVNGTTTQLSHAADGGPTNAHSMTPDYDPISQTLVFATRSSNLVVGDTNNKIDLFIHDLVNETFKQIKKPDIDYVSNVTFDLTVNNVAPVIAVTNALVVIDESDTATNTGTFSDVGVDLVNLTTSLGTVTDNLDGTWSWSFNSADGPDESQVVTITATDSDGAATSTTFDLVVNNVAPTIAVTNALVTINEAQTATNTGTFSDVGVDLVNLTTTLGTVTDNLDGTWSWSFDSSDGPDESQVVTITATDSDGAATNVTFDLTVNNVAPAIAVTNALVTIDEAQTATNTGTFSDVGVDALVLTTTLGTVTDNLDGTWSWSFDSADGPDESQVVTVTATDSDGAATNVTFDLTVNNVAPAIAVTNALVVINEADTATNTGTFSDVGVDLVNLTTSLGTVTDNLDGTWSWSFDSADGPDESQVVTVTATDSDGAATNVTFDLTVNNVAPVIAVTNALVTIDESDTATNTGTFSDVGVDLVNLTTSLGVVTDNLDGTWSWSFNSADGPDESQVVTVTATDSDGAATNVTFDLTVNNVAPTIAVTNALVVIDEADTATNTGTFSDVGVDLVNLTTSLGTVTDNLDGTWSWSFDSADGPDESQVVTVTATDSDGAATSTTFDLVVNNVAPAIVISSTSGASQVNVNVPYSISVSVSDPGTDILTQMLVDWGDGGVLEAVPVGSGPFSHAYTATGNYSVQISAVDEDGTWQSNSLNVDVIGITLVEASNFEVIYSEQVTLSQGTNALSMNILDLQFDMTDIAAPNDAFEIAFIDTGTSGGGNSLVGTIGQGHDSFFNLSEPPEAPAPPEAPQPPLAALGNGVTYDSATGQVVVDVSHLPAGTTGTVIFRLVNNDTDVTTQVTLDPTVTQLAVSPVPNPSTATLSNISYRNTQAIDLDRLSDITNAFIFDYAQSSFNADTGIWYADLTLTSAVPYAISNSLVVGIRAISDPSVQAIGDGQTAQGMVWYDISDLVNGQTVVQNEVVAGIDLQFDNPNRVQFSYELVVLGLMNESPVFTSTPDDEVVAGQNYTYQLQAIDPEGDDLVYELVSGPDGMILDSQSNTLVWSSTGNDVGTQPVFVRVTDIYGGFDVQMYTIDVVEGVANRPPMIISVPVVDAYIGDTTYQYQAAATDPDGNILTYSLVDGQAAGLSVDANTGMVTWSNVSSDLVDQLVDVTLQVSDGNGGMAEQVYQILVHEDVNNHAPMFVSEPITHYGIVDGNSSTGSVDPPQIDLDLDYQETQQQTVNITLGTSGTGLGEGFVPPSGPLDVMTVYNEDDATTLAEILTLGGGAGLLVTGANLATNTWYNGQDLLASGAGVYVNNNDTYGMSDYGVVLTSGNAQDYGSGLSIEPGHTYGYGIAGTPDQQNLLQPLANENYVFDVTQLDITFDMLPGYDTVYFNVVFGSEEYDEFVGSSFIDAFGLYVNGTNIALVDNLPVNINHPSMDFVGGTELDGVLVNNGSYVVTFSAFVGEGTANNTLTFIIGDASDAVLDTTVYISSLGAQTPTPVDIEIVSSDPLVGINNLTGPVAGVSPGAVASFDVEFTGTGSVESFDLQFVDMNSGVLLGTIPVKFNSNYFYLAQAVDPDGDVLVYSLVDAPSGSVIDSQTGEIYWAPDTAGEYLFTVRVTDGRGGYDDQYYTLTVDGNLTNTNPVITSSPATLTAELGRGYSYQVQAVDQDGNDLRYYLANSPEGMSIDTQTGLVVWTPTVGQDAVDHSVSVMVLDGKGGKDTQVFSLYVPDYSSYISVNQQPVITTVPSNVAYIDVPYIYDMDATDPDGDLLTYELLTGPDGVSINSLTGQLVWQPKAISVSSNSYYTALDPNTGLAINVPVTGAGTYYIAVAAVDVSGGVDVQTWAVDVEDDNQNPVIGPTGDISIGTGYLLEYQVQATDPNGDSLIYSIDDESMLKGISILPQSGLIQWVPTIEQIGTHSVIVSVTDGRGGSSSEAITLKVSENAPAQIESIPGYYVTLGETYMYDIVVSDSDGNPGNIVLKLDRDSTARGMILNGTSLQWTPNQVGAYEVSVTAVDQAGAGQTQVFTINVIPQVVQSTPPDITSIPAGPAIEGVLYEYILTATDADAGDTVDFSLTGGPVGMSVDFDSLTSQWVLSWTPTVGSAGNYDVEVTATDSTATATIQSFTLPVVAQVVIGTAPQITSLPDQNIRLNEVYSYQVTATDPNNLNLTYELVSGPVGATLNASGLLSWSPQVIGVNAILIRVENTNGYAVTQSFDLNVISSVSTSTPPEITSIPVGPAVEGVSYEYILTATDADAGDTVDFSLTGGPVGMSVDFDSLTSQWVLSWTPPVGSAGNYDVEVTATDSTATTTIQSFTLPVVAQVVTGTAPQITSLPDQNIRLNEVYSYQVTATDPNNLNLTYELVSGPVGATFNASGLLSWSPQVLGVNAIAIRVKNTDGYEVTQSFSLNVIPSVSTNTPPAITSTPTSPASVNNPYQYQVIATDVEGDTLSYTLDVDSISRGMSIDSGTGLLTWTPLTAGTGSVNVVVTVSDGEAVAIQTYTLPIISNTPPQFTSTPIQLVALGGLYEYTITYTDSNPEQTVVLSLDNPLVGMTIEQNISGDSVLTWDPALNLIAEGIYTVTLVADDGAGGITTQVFPIQVFDPVNNSAPQIISQPRDAIAVGQQFIYQMVAADAEGDSLTYELMGTPPTGMQMTSDGIVTWTPTSDQGATGANSHNWTVRVTDARNAYTEQTYVISVVSEQVNRAPEITSAPTLYAAVGLQWTYEPTAMDADGDSVFWQLNPGQSRPVGMSIDTQTGIVTWKANADQVGQETITLRATDTFGAYTDQTFTLNVVGTNRGPLITSTPVTNATTGQSYGYQVQAVDPDGDTVTYTLTSYPSGMAIDAATGLVSWTAPGTVPIDPISVTVRVTDSQGAATDHTWSIVIEDSTNNQPPRITSSPESYYPLVGVEYQYQVLATDPNGNQLTYTLLSGPDGIDSSTGKMILDPNTGLMTWTPIAGQSGSQRVKIQVSDGFATVVQSFNLFAVNNVAPVFPTIADLSVSAGSTLRTRISATDPDNDYLTYALVSGPEGLSIDQYGQITWQTTLALAGSAFSVAVQVTDSYGQTDTTSLTINVVADTQDPEIYMVVNNTNPPMGTEILFYIQATDNVAIADLSLAIGGQAVAIDNQGYARFTLQNTTEISAVATARDEAGRETTQLITLNAYDPNDLTPLVTITVPQDDAILTSPTDVLVTVDDPDDGLTNYTLYLVDDQGNVVNELGTGTTTELTNAVFGRVDTTAVSNGAYTLRLVAQDVGGNTAIDEQFITIDSNAKIGNFSLGFTDLTTSLGGLPITIGRTYDTLNAKEVGDFGYGWNLDLFDMDIRTDVDMGTFGASGGLSDIGLIPSLQHGSRLHVTLPDGTKQSFTMQVVPLNSSVAAGLLAFTLSMYRVEFVPDAGNTSTLTTTLPQLQVFMNDYGELETGSGVPFNPASPLLDIDYIMTTVDGTSFRLNGNTGQLDTITDRQGNRLEISDSGIRTITPDGNIAAQITFTRDYLDRIIQITDTAGQSINYTYNINGNLVSVTDRASSTTSFIYDPAQAAGREHFLTSIQDARGISVMNLNFDATTGRIVSLADASGAAIPFTYDLNPPQLPTGYTREILADATPGSPVPTQIIRDARGNTVRQLQRISDNSTLNDTTDDVWSITVYEYDANDYRTRTSETFQATGDLAYTATPTTWLSNADYDPFGRVLSATDALGNTTYFTYDRYGSLLTTTDAQGNTNRNTYDDKGLLTATTDALGNVTTYAYDNNGNMTAVTDSTGNVVSTFVYASGLLTSTTSIDGQTRTFTYDINGNQIAASSVGIGGTIVTSTTMYDDQNRVIGSAQAIDGIEQWSTSTVYGPTGLVEYTIDRFGRVTENRYNSRGNLIETRSRTKDENGTLQWLVSRTVYDANGRAIYRSDTHIENDPDNLPQASSGSHTIYDSLGRVIETQRLDNLIIGMDTSNTSGGGVEESVLLDPGTVRLSSRTIYDSAGRVEQSISAVGVITLYEYDVAGRQTAVVQDVDGDLLTLADQLRTETQYDSLGRQTMTRDALGRETQFVYDVLGRVMQTIYADGTVSGTTIYDTNGRLIAETDQLGRTKQYEYDAAGRLTAVILPAVEHPDTGELVHPRYEYEYDAYGNQTLIRDNVVQLADGTVVYNHDLDPNDDSRSTVFTYDYLGRTVSRTLPMGQTEWFMYNNTPIASGNTSGGTSGGGQLEYQIDFEGRVTAYEYDNSATGGGRLTSKLYFANLSDYQDYVGGTSGGGTIGELETYTYDAQGRTLTIVQDFDGDLATLSDQRVESRTYNTDGQLAMLVTPQGTIGYEYDPFGRKIRTWTQDSVTPSTDTRYNYDILSRLQTVTAMAIAGETLTAPATTTYTYDVVGNLSSVLLPNNVLTEYVYDDLNRLDFMSQTRDNGSGTLISSYDYVLGIDGTRQSVTEVQETPGSPAPGSYETTTITWTYDGLNRLVTEQMVGPVGNTALTYETRYVFDLVGNRLSKTTDNDLDGMTDETTLYVYDPNDRLVAESTVNASGGGTDTVYEYGASGASGGGGATQQTGKYVTNRITGEVISDDKYEYNLQGKLWIATKVDSATGDTTVQKYTYNTTGTRVAREETVNGISTTRTNYLIDPTGGATGYAQTLEETVIDVTTQQQQKKLAYLLGLDVIGQGINEASLAIHWLLSDGHGSTRALLNAAAELLEVYHYDAYGNALNFAPATALTSLLYSGEFFDSRINLQYLRARWYDPASGRFNRADPFAGNQNDPQSLHKYLYTHGNPIMGVDPSGESLIEMNITVSIQSTLLSLTAIPLSTALKIIVGTALVAANIYYIQGIMSSGRPNTGIMVGELVANADNLTANLEEIENRARQAGKVISEALRKTNPPPIWFVFKSLTPYIYDGTADYLSRKPQFYQLNYLGIDPSQKAKNRYSVVSRYRHLRTTYLNEIDEYPYASTLQGGRPNAEGWPVPGRENRIQGSGLRWFYALNLKGIKGRSFYVMPIPFV